MIVEFKKNGNKNEALKRRHYRMGCLWDISCQEEAEEENKQEKKWFSAVTTDISGGGCRFNSSVQPKDSSILIIKITEPNKKREELIFKAQVIASLPLPNRREIYETRVKFIELSFLKQEQLIKWIFEEKRKLKWQERGSSYEEKYFNY